LNNQGAAKSGLLEVLHKDDIDHLSLEHTTATDEQLAPLYGFTGVQQLHLQFTRVDGSSFQQLRQFTKLQRVSAWWSKLRDSALGHLAAIEALAVLDVSRTNVSDDGLSRLVEGGANGLRVLVVQNNAITDAGVERLSRLHALTELHIGGTKISDSSIPHLARLHSLNILNIGQTEISWEGCQKLRSLLPHCQIQYDEQFAVQQSNSGCRLV
jgi:hypothetical protein